MIKTLSVEFVNHISNLTCFVGEYEDNELKDVFGWIRKIEIKCSLIIFNYLLVAVLNGQSGFHNHF